MNRNRFPNTLKLEYYPDLKDEFLLLEDFTFICNDGLEIVAEKGLSTDLASIPRVFRWLFKGHNRYTYGAIPHDWIYQHKGVLSLDDGSTVGVSRKRADDVLYEACIAAGVSKWKAKMIYAAVRAGGWVMWNKKPL